MPDRNESIPTHNPEPLDIGLPTPAEAAVLRDLVETPQIIAELRTRIAEVAPVVAHAGRVADAEARTQLAKQIEIKLLNDAPGRLEDIWRMHDARIAQIENDHQLSPQGRREQREAVEEIRESDILEAFKVADGHAESLVHRASPPRSPTITTEVAAHITTVASMFGPMLPQDFVGAALATLATAVDPTAPEEVREAHTSILTHAYVPLLRRRATQPEKFAEGLRSTYGQVLELVEEHIGARAAKHRAATAIRDEFRSTWRTLHTTAKSSGRWDSFIADIAMGR